MKEIKLNGRVSGVNIGDDDIYTSFITIPRNDITPQGCILTIRGVRYIIGTPAVVTVNAETVPELEQ